MDTVKIYVSALSLPLWQKKDHLKNAFIPKFHVTYFGTVVQCSVLKENMKHLARSIFVITSSSLVNCTLLVNFILIKRCYPGLPVDLSFLNHWSTTGFKQ